MLIVPALAFLFWLVAAFESLVWMMISIFRRLWQALFVWLPMFLQLTDQQRAAEIAFLRERVMANKVRKL